MNEKLPPKKSIAARALAALDKIVNATPFGDRRPNEHGNIPPKPGLADLLRDPEWLDARTTLDRRREMLRHVDESDLATPAALDHAAFMTRLAAEVGKGSVLTPDESGRLKDLCGTWDRIASTIEQLAAVRSTKAGMDAALTRAVGRLTGVDGLVRLVEADDVRTKEELRELASKKIRLAKAAARELGPQVAELAWEVTARVTPLITRLRVKAEADSSNRSKLWGFLRRDDDVVRGMRHFEVGFVSQLPRRNAPIPLDPRSVQILAWAAKNIAVENVTVEMDPLVEKLPAGEPAPAGTEGGSL